MQNDDMFLINVKRTTEIKSDSMLCIENACGARDLKKSRRLITWLRRYAI